MGSREQQPAPAPFPRRPIPAAIGGRFLEPGRRETLPLRAGEALHLGRCFSSGQIFRWRQRDDWWYGPFAGSALAVRGRPEGVEVELAGPPQPLREVYRFLALDAPVDRIEAALAADPCLRPALTTLRGLRILRQDPWECIAGFLCSQWNNIPKIEGSTGRIAERWGRAHDFRRPGGNVRVHSFPPAAVLAGLVEADLRACALGYRSRYLLETAGRVAESGGSAESLRGGEYDSTLAALLGLPGIGRKVADCVLLFALDRWEAFPVDVWVRRAMNSVYGSELDAIVPPAVGAAAPMSAREHRALVQFAWGRWGGVAGWAQQYLFCAVRERLVRPPSSAPAASG